MSFGVGAQPFASAAKPTFGSSAFTFGSGTTSSTTNTFGGFGSTTTANVGFGGFGTPAVTTSTFGTFNVNPSTTTTGFSGFSLTSTSSAPPFGFGNTQTTSISTFPAFGTTTTTSSSLFPSFGGNTGTAAGGSLFGSTGFGGFGSSNTTFGANPTGFGATTGTAPPFGSTAFGNTGSGFGSAFPNTGSLFPTKAPSNTTGFPGFGGAVGNSSIFGQQQQQQSLNINEALTKAIFNPNIFQDERDQILAKYNFLQAKWGFGKSYYAPNQYIELTEHNPLCRFKAIGYNCFLTTSDSDGLVQLLFNKSEQELKNQQQQLQTSLTALLGNKPTLTVTLDSIKPATEAKTQVIIFVIEKSATGGSGTKIPASELSQFLNGPQQRQQLASLGAISALPHARPDPRYLQEYLEVPPPGIDIRLWKQAQADNPDPEKYFPTPMIGFSEVKWRMKCQEEETQIHSAFLSKAAEEINELKAKLTAAHATLQEQRRRFVHLHHRLFAVVLRQESIRKSGVAITSQEEALRCRLEVLHSQLSTPTQFNGRLSELLSQMRMQRSQASMQKLERYAMDKASQDDIKQFLAMQHKGMTHLIETVNVDLEHFKIMHEGMNKIVQESE